MNETEKQLSSNVQHTVPNLQGKSVYLDIYAEDAMGNRFNVEVQRSDAGADPRLARYHGSVLDSNMVLIGSTTAHLADTYVIFITEHDVRGKGLPMYHIERVSLEERELFHDGSHIIYVNSMITKDTELGKLMSDFQCEDYKEMRYDVLRDRVKYFKDEREGIAIMKEYVEYWEVAAMEEGKKRGFEEGKLAGIEEGKSEGIEQERKNTVAILKKMHHSDEEIAENLHITLEQVRSYLKDSVA